MHNLELPNSKPEASIAPETKVTDELKASYAEKVGKMWRPGTSIELTRQAIQNPTSELERLAEIDKEDNKLDLVSPYTNKQKFH